MSSSDRPDPHPDERCTCQILDVAPCPVHGAAPEDASVLCERLDAALQERFDAGLDSPAQAGLRAALRAFAAELAGVRESPDPRPIATAEIEARLRASVLNLTDISPSARADFEAKMAAAAEVSRQIDLGRLSPLSN